MTETDHARQNAAAWSETIAEMIRALEAGWKSDGDGGEAMDAREAILDSALSVEVRSGWYSPCDANPEAVEYQILLSTGGPACRITGQLGAYGSPGTAGLEYQDWGTPWTRYPLACPEAADVLTFAQQFYFGE